MENALRAKPEYVREQYERQLKELQVAYGEVVLEIRARKKLVFPQEIRLGSAGTCRADQGADRGGAVVWLLRGRSVARNEQEHSAVDIPDQELAGAQTVHRISTAHPGTAFGGHSAHSALGSRSVPRLEW